VGFQSQDGVRALMQRARVLVLPSLEEGMGVVLVEAMACGTPVVASRVDGILDVVAPDVGVLVPPKDPMELAKGIRTILENPIRWKEYSHQARARAVNYYSWDRIASQFVEIYRSLI
jgi:glycosyltransferase involved in cell wall biosynthesis